jgi:hypothetical protein
VEQKKNPPIPRKKTVSEPYKSCNEEDIHLKARGSGISSSKSAAQVGEGSFSSSTSRLSFRHQPSTQRARDDRFQLPKGVRTTKPNEPSIDC